MKKKILLFCFKKHMELAAKHPKLWEYRLTEKGSYERIRTDIERIEFKNIEFSINGKRYPLTAKSRTTSKQKLT